MINAGNNINLVSIQEKDTYGIDFLYEQIKEIWDQIGEYQDSVGNFTESRTIVRSFIVEKKNKGGFTLFKNNELLISAIDMSTTGKESIEIEIHILSPIINDKYGSSIETKWMKLNASDIEKFIKDTLELINLKEISIENNYLIRENGEIEKTINFGNGGEDEIVLLRGGLLKLHTDNNNNNNILGVKQTSKNNYIIICQNFEFTINIIPNQLVINGNLEDILAIENIYPNIEQIIEKNKEIFGNQNSQDIKKESSSGIKKLFSFGNKKNKKSITNIPKEQLNKAIQRISGKRSMLSKFQSNLEMGFIDDLEDFDDDVKDDVKDILIELIEEILEYSERIETHHILYTAHLMHIFRRTTNSKNLISLYKYVLSNENLSNKYKYKIKKKLLESHEYEGDLFYQLFSCGDTDYYSNSKEEGQDMIFSKDNMQVISTNSDNTKLESYNIALRKKSVILKQRKHTYSKISSDGRYIFFNKDGLLGESNMISDLQENEHIRANGEFNNNTSSDKYLLNKYFIIKIDYGNREPKFQVYNAKNDTTTKVGIALNKDLHCMIGDIMYFFELETTGNRNNKTQKITNLSSYNLGNGDLKLLTYLVNPRETPIDICGNDNNFFLVVKDTMGKLILRSVNIKDGYLSNETPIDYDISCFKHTFKERNIHISNDGYLLLQDENDIYIINLNEGKVSEKEGENNNIKHGLKMYKITPQEKLKHFFKVEFVNSPVYGRFAVCRDGNQIHKIDIGLIEELVTPVYVEDINRKLEEKRLKRIKLKEQSIIQLAKPQQLKDEKKEILSEKQEKSTKSSDIEKYNKQELSRMGKQELHREMVNELRETRILNTMILAKLEESNNMNNALMKEIKEIKDELREKNYLVGSI